EELRAAYDSRLSQYTEAEKIQARHILIRVAPNASDSDVKKAEESIKALEARIRGGEDFAEVAKANGQDGTAPNGGDLGWFTDGQMVPEFSKAAFALGVGEMSGPVRTQFGFHLIKKEGHQAAKVHSFDEVKDELRTALATEKAGSGLEEKADLVLAQALAGKSLEEAAKAAASSGIKVETTDSLNVEELASKLDLRESDVKNIMAVSAGTVIDSPVPSGASLLVVKVLESKPQSVKPLDEVRPLLVEFLSKQKAAELAMDEARKARASFKDDKSAEGMEVKTTAMFGRDGNIADFVADPALARAVFLLPGVDGKWLNEAFRVQDGAVLVRLAGVEAPTEEAWKQAEADVMNQMLNDRAGMMYQTYIEQLGEQAEIKTFNSPLLGKLNQQ
ncbi:MAG: peptidylprolyl isomerase, partial [Mailhella sp.]|nr:peptidylprolyl isomerase [Mailhella sp.]